METQPKPLTVSALQLINCGADKRFAGRYVEPLNARLAKAEINTPLRFCHLLAQLLHESDRMKTAREYADGSGYEGRADLGNVKPGDGKRFRGRGLIQLTGRSNYQAYSKHTGIDYVGNPEWLERPQDAVAVSLWYWTMKAPSSLAGFASMNVLADNDDVLGISQAINQGSKEVIKKDKPRRKLPNGYNDRVFLLKACKAVFLFDPLQPAGVKLADTDGGEPDDDTTLTA